MPRKTALPDFTPPENVIVSYKTGATFNDEVICDYLEKVVKPYVLTKGSTNATLIFDSAKCHLTTKVTQKLAEINVGSLIVPPRLTNLLQPADVCWFGKLKSRYHQVWNNWFIHDERTFTRHDNARSPGYAKCIEWLASMWNEFDLHLIKNSFEQCGIVNQYSLHSALSHIINSKTCLNDYVDDVRESDNIDGFESDDDLFEPEPPQPQSTSTPQQQLQQQQSQQASIHGTPTSTALINYDTMNARNLCISPFIPCAQPTVSLQSVNEQAQSPIFIQEIAPSSFTDIELISNASTNTVRNQTPILFRDITNEEMQELSASIQQHHLSSSQE